MIRLFFCSTIIFSFYSCIYDSKSNDSKNYNAEIKSLNWFNGSWLDSNSTFGQGRMGEQWNLTNDTIFGKGFLVNGTDTNLYEEVLIYKYNDTSIAYHVFSPSKETIFISDSLTNNFIRFSNYSNDFPQEIEYLQKDSDASLLITLKGIPGGIKREPSFKLYKITDIILR